MSPQQTPLEHVREIGAALGVQINAQQQAHLPRVVRAPERPVLPPGHAPGQERLAAQFLKDTTEQNHADSRLAPSGDHRRRLADGARSRGERRMVNTIDESIRQLFADRIKTGGTLDAELRHGTPVLRDRGRSR